AGPLFNCAVPVHRGRVLGITPKTYLPNYREFYEKRQFTAGRDAIARDVELLGQRVPFGNDLLFDVTNVPGFAFACEICEDIWAPIPPTTYAAFAGATVLLTLSPPPAPRSCGPCRPAKSPPAGPTPAAASARRNRGGASPPISTRPPASASR